MKQSFCFCISGRPYESELSTGFRRFAPTSLATAVGALARRKARSKASVFVYPEDLMRASSQRLPDIQKPDDYRRPAFLLAVRAGFEPAVRLPVRQFSKLVVSATHPSHQADPFSLTGLQIYEDFIVLQYFRAFLCRPGCFSSCSSP